MGLGYFFDSYAIIELIKGNPKYAGYLQEEVTLTQFNLAEIYWSILNDFNEEIAEKIYDKYREAVVEIDDNVMKEAIKFRKKHKKANLSYTDCIGYVYAIKNNLLFLTGDRQFQDFENVEFIPK